MRLKETLERRLEGEDSPFQQQLLREDLARLGRLDALLASTPDADAFVKAGLRVGWTPGDARTAELREALEPFLRAVHARDEDGAVRAWHELHRVRLERLLGCLATPVPKPAG